MKEIYILSVINRHFFCFLLIFLCSFNAWPKDIYISNGGSDLNQGTKGNPISTLFRAKQLCQESQDTSFTIFLKAGEIFMNHTPIKTKFDGNRTFSFVWDLDKELILTTYGNNDKALLYGGYYAHSGGPVGAILVTKPSTKHVVIENLAFQMWEEATIVVSETKNVIIRNIDIEKVGSYYFYQDEKITSSFFPSAIYPKNSSNILIENIFMKNVLNKKGDRDGLHGFYCTRLSDSEIRNCTMINVCGSAFKVRRAPRQGKANNIYIHDNKCYYTGTSNLSPAEDDVQPGFLRFSGEFYPDGTPNCPSKIIIKDNVFHYPFVWENEGEDPLSAYAYKCSTSNETACGDQACAEDPQKVQWINNSFKYNWEYTDLWTGRNRNSLSAPYDLKASSNNKGEITLTWKHDGLFGERFVIQRKEIGKEFEAIRIVKGDMRIYTDKNINKSSHYIYRIKSCHDNTNSEYSEETEIN